MSPPPPDFQADFQALFEQGPAALLVLVPDARFTIVAATEAYLRRVGMRREALVGRGFFEVFPDHPRDPQAGVMRALRASLERALATRAPDPMPVQKYDLPRPESAGGDLEERYWSTRNTPLLGADGRVRYLVHQVEEVTAAVRLTGGREVDRAELRALEQVEEARRELQESQERLRRVMEASGVGTWELDVESGQVTADARHLALLGLPAGIRLDLETTLGAIHPEDRERVRRAVSAAVAGEREGRYLSEYCVASPGSARERWVEGRGQAIFDAEGKAVRLVGTSLDVTARKAAERERERLLAETEAIFQSIPDALYVGGADGIRRANVPALEQLGFDSLEELNRNVATLAREIQTRRVDTGAPIPAEDQAFTHALQGQADVQEVRVRHRKTGEDRVVRSSCAPIRVGGEVVGAVGINSDITERKRAEEALRARAEFEQQLIGIVSHDLRNPLAAILLGLQNLLHREGHDAPTLKTLLRLQSGAEHAAQMVRDLLDFTQARLGTGIPVRPQPVDLYAVARQVVEEVQLTYAERTLLLRQEGDVRGQWDPGRLSQVVSNLVINAVKYSPPDTPVTVVVRAEEEAVVLSVHNQGTPLTPALRERLFEPMWRGPEEVDAAGRSVGLGLYIVERLVRAHAGHIGVTSTAEEGTTFTVRLPRAADGFPLGARKG